MYYYVLLMQTLHVLEDKDKSHDIVMADRNEHQLMKCELIGCVYIFDSILPVG